MWGDPLRVNPCGEIPHPLFMWGDPTKNTDLRSILFGGAGSNPARFITIPNIKNMNHGD
jgi:hypothetical protein